MSALSALSASHGEGPLTPTPQTRIRDRIFLAAVETCPGDSGEVVAKSSATRGGDLNGAAALAGRLGGFGTERRIFVLIFASLF